MLTAFTAGLLLITVSELGDKTFFIAAILAMRHARRWVLFGTILALSVMTLLSVAMGRVFSFLPPIYVQSAEVLLFAAFGLKLLYDASRMTSQNSMEECGEAEAAIRKAETGHTFRTPWSIVAEAFSLVFIGEWGDRTQIATITLAASQNPFGVTAGAILGHAICAAIAVVSGRLICNRLSERTITGLGGGLFLLFAVIGLVDLIRM